LEILWSSSFGPGFLPREQPPHQGRGAFLFNRRAARGARQERIMAQERKRGNREAKKPKAAKPAVDPAAPKMPLGQLTPVKKPKPAR
jgi:hypothetical protein